MTFHFVLFKFSFVRLIIILIRKLRFFEKKFQINDYVSIFILIIPDIDLLILKTNTNFLKLQNLGSITPTNVLSPSTDQRHANNSDYDNGPLLKRTRMNENWSS